MPCITASAAPKGQAFPGSAAMVALVSQDQPGGAAQGTFLASWPSATAQSPLMEGNTLGWLWALNPEKLTDQHPVGGDSASAMGADHEILV